MFESLQEWYGALPARKRTIYGFLVAIIVATIPCYCLGGWALTLDLQFPPRATVPVPTATFTPTATQTSTATTALTSTPTETLEPTPTQEPTDTPTIEVTPTETPTVEVTPTETPTETPTATPTVTDTPSPTATVVETETMTPTVTPTVTPSATPTTAPPTGTPTTTPTVGPTASPTTTPVSSMSLSVQPPNGPAGIEITISGSGFVAYAPYRIYWDSQDTLIGDLFANDIGQIAGFTYTVPVTTTAGLHVVLAGLPNGTMVANTVFTVVQ